MCFQLQLNMFQLQHSGGPLKGKLLIFWLFSTVQPQQLLKIFFTSKVIWGVRELIWWLNAMNHLINCFSYHYRSEMVSIPHSKPLERFFYFDLDTSITPDRIRFMSNSVVNDFGRRVANYQSYFSFRACQGLIWLLKCSRRTYFSRFFLSFAAALKTPPGCISPPSFQLARTVIVTVCRSRCSGFQNLFHAPLPITALLIGCW